MLIREVTAEFSAAETPGSLGLESAQALQMACTPSVTGTSVVQQALVVEGLD